jgi:hypothetical protein
MTVSPPFALLVTMALSISRSNGLYMRTPIIRGASRHQRSNYQGKSRAPPSRPTSLWTFAKAPGCQETGGAEPQTLASAPGRQETEGAETPDFYRYGVLLSVPLVWGTYGPAVRYMYQMDVPMPGFLFSALYYIVSLSTLVAARALSAPRGVEAVADDKGDEAAAEEDGSPDEAVSATRAGLELGLYLYLGNILQVLVVFFEWRNRWSLDKEV